MPASGGQHDQEDVVLMPPLDPGKSFQFYAVNQSNLCAWLIPPDSAMVTMLGDKKESQVALTFDKNPLYAAGAPSFPVTGIKWEGIPAKPGGYGIIRTGARSCEGDERRPVLSVEWYTGVPPTTFPPEGRLFLLQLWPLPVENGGGGLVEMSGKPGSELGWQQGNIVHECRLTNYSDVTLFNVRIVLHLIFRKLKEDPKQPGSRQSGDVSLSRDWLITTQKIDVGPDHSFTFYISNSSDQFADVSFPDSATAQLAGDAERKTIKLMRPEGYMSTLPPIPVSEPDPR